MLFYLIEIELMYVPRLFYLNEKNNQRLCRNAGSYFKVHMDARSLCHLAALLRNNHTAISVSPLGEPTISDFRKKFGIFGSFSRSHLLEENFPQHFALEL